MVIQPVIRSAFTLTLFLLVSLSPLFSSSASDKSLSLFQYATPLELPQIASSQLVEIRLSKPMFKALRNDFADLRVVQQSNGGVVPVKVVRLGPPEHALVSRSFSVIQETPADLSYRYPDSGIVLIETGRVPLTDARVSLDNGVAGGALMFLGRGGAHTSQTEWRLLKHLRLEEGVSRLDIRFNESSFEQYALVADHGQRVQFSIASVYGPDYHAYFVAQPQERYTLLCGYPDALPITGFSVDSIELLLKKEKTPVQVTVSSLINNEKWSGLSLKGFAFQRSFLIPLAVVVGLVFLLFLFVLIYTLANRKRPVKIEPRPRFFK